MTQRCEWSFQPLIPVPEMGKHTLIEMRVQCPCGTKVKTYVVDEKVYIPIHWQKRRRARGITTTSMERTG